MRDLETRRWGVVVGLFCFESHHRNPKMRRTFRGSVTERAVVKKGSEPTLGAFHMEERERLKEGYAV